MLDIGGLDEGFPVIGEMPKCSDTLVCKWRYIHILLFIGRPKTHSVKVFILRAYI